MYTDSILGNFEISKDAVDEVAANCSSLLSLSFSGLEQVDDDTLLLLANCAENLKELNLYRCTYVR